MKGILKFLTEYISELLEKCVDTTKGLEYTIIVPNNLPKGRFRYF